MEKIMKGLIVTLFGVATTVLTAGLLVFIKLKLGFSLYNFTFWFVLPIGAILSGFLAATGYPVGLRLIHHRADRGLRSAVLLSSVATFFLIYWMQYKVLTVSGRPLSDLLSYGQFLVHSLSHTSMQLSYGVTAIGGAFDLGFVGYAYAAIQIIGLCVGGAFIYEFASGLSYCEDCKLYLNRKGQQTRYFEGAEDMKQSIARFGAQMQANQFQEAIRTHAETGTSQKGKYEDFSTTIVVKQCKGCKKHWINFSGKHKGENGWKRLPDLNLSKSCVEQIDVISDQARSS